MRKATCSSAYISAKEAGGHPLPTPVQDCGNLLWAFMILDVLTPEAVQLLGDRLRAMPPSQFTQESYIQIYQAKMAMSQKVGGWGGVGCCAMLCCAMLCSAVPCRAVPLVLLPVHLMRQETALLGSNVPCLQRD